MKWLHFLSGSRKDEPGMSKSSSLRTQSNPSTDCGLPGSGSDFNSLNTSDASAESSGRTSAHIFSQRHNTLREFTMSELKNATKNFSMSLLLGEGGFGCVYKGVIKSTQEPHAKIDVAVKQLNRNSQQGQKEWMTEVNVLGIVDHPNLVKLIGYCAEDDERGIQRLLVYEFMPNISVAHHLLPKTDSYLSWSMRLKIALDAAQGLAYLHEGIEIQIIFRDFKSANILLDEQWNAKLSDFGLARQGPAEGLSHVSTAVVGTLGYAAPEYMHTGRLNYRSDIWSYGVFLYELITGRLPLDRNLPKGEQKMLDWVRPYLSDARSFRMIMDKRLEVKCSLKSAMRLAKVANKCLSQHPKNRPKMSEVVEMVRKIIDSTKTGAPQPPLVCDTAEGTAKKGEKKDEKRLSSEEKLATSKEGAKKQKSLKRRMSEFKWADGWWARWSFWTLKVIRTN